MKRPQVIDDEEHERVHERVAAIDVAKDSGMVCTPAAGGAAGQRLAARQPGRPHQRRRPFPVGEYRHRARAVAAAEAAREQEAEEVGGRYARPSARRRSPLTQHDPAGRIAGQIGLRPDGTAETSRAAGWPVNARSISAIPWSPRTRSPRTSSSGPGSARQARRKRAQARASRPIGKHAPAGVLVPAGAGICGAGNPGSRSAMRSTLGSRRRGPGACTAS